MITDARVLQTEFVPKDLVHRDNELTTLSAALKPLTNGEPGETTLLHGPPGVGKTCTTQYILNQLHENVIDLNTQYVNCWKDHTQFQTLYRILEGIDQTLDIHRQSTPTDKLRDRLHNYDGPPYIVVLDEADQLETTDVLYNIYRTPNIEMVLIANQEADLFSRLDTRLKSRLQTITRIHYKPYRSGEIVSILEDRVHWGLEPDTVTRDQLERIAVASKGDSRVAIGVLRRAARLASQDNERAISDEYIDEAVPEAKTEIKQKNVEKLTEDQRILYDILTEEGEISAGRLYESYRDRADEPKTRRMMRYYLKKMQHYNLVVANGENRGRTYNTSS
ncbi:orc1/cdc6 family replication initiation protein [Natronococcus amylolyticus DSM 10524]|uniref:Orc1/cdc6 family replication initiation protein n=1 Tax=Natronococcus amylolyticus DSM 10524 TaxID=1227497 RepID=L9WYR9_9EURY|nr:Cdc6/Cdc18 family protein [Natronococcus amylolyticus]ELY54552.1 orc1/cdc6 family replication initiation protein [Natronococcus amylolyticus DSM 10524]